MSEPSVDLVIGTVAGGVGIHVRALAAGLIARQHRVRVIGPRETETTFGFTECGAEFEAMPIGSALRPLHDGQVVRELRGLVSADVVHAHGLRASALAGVATGSRPLVATWHNAVLDTGVRGWLGHQLERLAARRASVVLAASEDLLQRARECGARDARLAPVPAPTLGVSRARDQVRRDLGLEGPTVLSVSRLHPQKDLHTLVNASALLARELPDLRVLVAGDGPLRDELERAIEAAGAPVMLLGRRQDTGDLLVAADAAVLTSRWEARSLAAQEALIADVPLVATAVGGLPGLVGDAALLVPPGDALAVADALQRVLTDQGLRDELSAKAQRQVASWPDERQMLDQVERAYADALAGSR